MPEVVVNMMGGLGNQMFQYAAGKSLAERMKAELYLDHSFLEADSGGKYTQRNFELDVFNLKAKKADPKVLKPYLKLRRTDLVSRVQKKLFSSGNYFQFNENGFQYNPQFEKLSGNVYLHGFWQTEKYFSGIRNLLIEDFTLKTKLSQEALNFMSQIKASTTTVSIHFRRGDYVSLAEANAYHGLASMEYYKIALKRMKESFPDAHYFLFSDDPAWVQENFVIEKAIVVLGLSGCEDMELMKNCHHHIIANSSFSWWSAWLNNRENKKVIAPLKWFNDNSKNVIDLIPAQWEKI